MQHPKWLRRSDPSFCQRLLILVLLMPCLAGLAYGQSAKGSLNGVVTDVSGAVIPGAKVVAKQLATGLTKETVTSGEGTYSFPNLEPGTYELTVTASGFKTNVIGGVTVSVAFPLTINAQLEPGELQEVIEVSAGKEKSGKRR